MPLDAEEVKIMLVLGSLIESFVLVATVILILHTNSFTQIGVTYSPQLSIGDITFFDFWSEQVKNLMMNGFKIYDHLPCLIRLLYQ